MMLEQGAGRRPVPQRRGPHRPAGLLEARDAARSRQAFGQNPEVPTQPLSDTSTVTPSGAVYFTSTLV